MVQEMNLSNLQLIKASRWIQENFYITDVSNTNWADERYGTTTLVDKSLLIEQIFRVYCNSKFGRDAIFVDIDVAPALARSLTTKAESCLKTLQVGNTHLESLVVSPPSPPSPG
jgi:tyrosyl-DNA phosphodiesterase 2